MTAPPLGCILISGSHVASKMLKGVTPIPRRGGDVPFEEPTLGLLPYVAEMMAIEAEIEEALNNVPARLEAHADGSMIVGQLRTNVKRHRKALHRRLRELRSMTEEAERVAPRGTGEGAPGPRAPRDLLGSLRYLHGLLNEAAFGYAVLHAVAHRFFDSRGEGNTADLAEGQLREYAQAAHFLNCIVSDVAVWELGNLGQECECKCPSCGLGVCLCSPHGTNTVVDMWREMSAARAAGHVGGIRVRQPRGDSSAARAGLQAGDYVLAVNGQEIAAESWDSINAIQETIKKHQPGEAVRLQIRRASGTKEEIPVTRA